MKKELIVITGASAGIGLETAKQFAKLGHPLLLLARRVEPMQALKLANTMCMPVDVTDRAAFEDAVKLAESKYGAVGAIVNNAGIMLLDNIISQNPKEWDAMLDVNVKGLLNGVYAVAESMVKRNSGTIINISSIAGIKTFPNHTAYVGTKFAVSGLSENLREEMAPHNVRVITIEPGAVDTTLLSHTTDESIKENYNIWKEEMGGVLSVEDVSNAIIYAYNQPQNVCIREIVIAATKQLS
jgi:NADP-dependent 3-hydroxy acid dehydrogenase YdfG